LFQIKIAAKSARRTRADCRNIRRRRYSHDAHERRKRHFDFRREQRDLAFQI